MRAVPCAQTILDGMGSPGEAPTCGRTEDDAAAPQWDPELCPAPLTGMKGWPLMPVALSAPASGHASLMLPLSCAAGADIVMMWCGRLGWGALPPLVAVATAGGGCPCPGAADLAWLSLAGGTSDSVAALLLPPCWACRWRACDACSSALSLSSALMVACRSPTLLDSSCTGERSMPNPQASGVGWHCGNTS